MKISRTGIDLIKKWEGCRLTAYKDSVGVLTIGYGHTSAAGAPSVKSGMTITQIEADGILTADLVKYEAAVSKALTRSPTQSQFDAMVSLCYNIGTGGFAGSSVAKKFNAGDLKGAADAFLLWNKGGTPKRVIDGLTNRRAAERQLFLSATEAAPKPVAPVPVPPAPTPPPTPEPPPPATPANPGASIAGWVLGAAAALIAALAAWIMKG